MWVEKHTWFHTGLLIALIAGLAVSAAACGGSDSTTTSSSLAPTTVAPSTTTAEASTPTSGVPTTTPVMLTGEEATIAANWVKFFDGTVAPQDKIELLENGDQYEKELEANAASPLAKSSTASVSAVTITSPTGATVTYSILLAGQPALPDQTGQAVKQDGIWKVGAQSFLALLALQGGAIPPTTTAP